jgi:hypothetical protein
MNSPASVQPEWKIGLSAWIIQDGNYDDFEVGQPAEFALEFFPKKIQPTNSRMKSAKNLGDAGYDVVGEVVYLTPEVWVLDFGICAFQKSKPPEEMALGRFVAAEIYLGIDPYFYFEHLCIRPGMPPLIYSWKINSIGQQTAPFIETHEPSGQNIMARDETKLGLKALKRTDAWNDDDGHGEYILTSTQLGLPPKFESATAT